MDFGKAMMIVFTLTGTTIVAFFVVAHAARCFFTVMQDTAAGLDEATWPDEPFKDWMRSSAHLVGLFLIWLTPAGILARVLRHDFLPNDGPLRFVLIAGPALWLLLPIGLISALSSTSQWAPVRLTILRQMLRILPSLLLFYILTAVVGAVATVAWFYALFRGVAYSLPLAAAVGAAAMLIYARLLGRLGWLLARLKPLPIKKPALRARKAPAKRDMKSIRRAVRTKDPWAAPKGELTLPNTPALPVEGYGMSTEEPRKRKKRKKPAAEVVEETPAPLPVEGYDFSGAPVAEDNTLAQEAARLGQATLDLDKHLYQPMKPYVPPYPLFSGVFTFPWYASTMRHWVTMALGAGVVGFGIQAFMKVIE